MRRRAYLATAGAALLSGCGGVLGAGPGDCDEGCDVGMTTNAFRPETFETTVGTTVTWKNTSSHTHTVTAYGDGLPEGAAYFASGGFDSESAAREAWKDGFGGEVGIGTTFEHTFEVPGTYSYFCVPHERQGMVGRVRVRE